jgi:hypothetical protein
VGLGLGYDRVRGLRGIGKNGLGNVWKVVLWRVKKNW